MQKRMVAVLLGLAVVSAAQGALTKIREFTPVGDGLTENPDSDGIAVLQYKPNRGETIVDIVVRDFLPNTTYGIKIESNGAELSDPQALTTNPKGNGTFRRDVPGDASTNVRVTVYIWDGNTDPDSIFDVTASEIRAEGVPTATVTRIRDFTPAGAGTTLNPCGDGKAILNYRASRGETDVHVQITQFEPNTTYGVKIESTGAEISNPLAITTSCGANGHWTVSVPGDATGNARVTIYVWDGNPDPDSIIDVTASEMRAEGM